MPLKFTDLAMFATPMVPSGTGLDAANAAYANTIQDAHTREMRRYHDMMAEQERRRIAQAEEGTRQAAIAARNKLAADVLKTRMKQAQAEQELQQSTLVKAQERALIDPQGAQALLASAGMLVPPTMPPAAPAAPSAAHTAQRPALNLPREALVAGIDPNQIMADIEPLRQAKIAGIPESSSAPEAGPPVPGPGQFRYRSGGQEFAHDQDAILARRAEPIKQLFEMNLQLEDEEPDQEVAQKIAALTPKAVQAMPDAGPKEIVDTLLGQYNKELAHKQGMLALEKKMKKSRNGKSLDVGVGDTGKYAQFKTQARMVLKDLGFFEADEAIDNLRASHADIMSSNGTRQWNAIRRMIKTYESGRLSDFDVQMAKGYMSLWEETSNWFSEHAGGTLSPDIQQKIAESITTAGVELHKQVKDRIAVPMSNTATSSEVREERAAYKNLYNTMFDKKIYDWFNPLGEKAEAPKKPTDRKSLLDELEKKHGG